MHTTEHLSGYTFSHSGVWLLCEHAHFDIFTVRKENLSKWQNNKCVFTENLKAKYPFIKDDQQARKML
jgi:hypothetical protein